MSTSSIRIFTLALMAAVLCSLGCGSGTSGTPAGGAGAHAGSGGSAAGGGGGSAAGGSTGSGSCTVDNWTVTAAAYPSGLTLTSKCSPYTVDSITVKDGGVLTIEAGATLKFSDNTTIFVGQSGTGKLLVNGTAQNPVTLTTQPNLQLPGGWYGIEFWSGTASGSKVTYATIDYAGGNFDGAIVVESALPAGTLTLDHLTIDNNDTADGAVPIFMGDGSPTIACSNCTADGTNLTH
jgi:hypothetical protein